MASNTRPKFKHPIIREEKTEEDFRWIDPDELSSVCADDHIRRIQWRGLDVIIRSMIDLPEIPSFFSSVMSACYDEEHDLFMPEMLDFAVRANTVLRYSNIILPDDAEEQYRILYGTDLFQTVKDNICFDQVESIIKAAELSFSR